MATQKVLSVILKTVDQATAPIKGLLGTLGKFGTELLRVDKLIAASARTTLRVLTSLKTAAIAVVAALAVGKALGEFRETLNRLDDLAKRARDFGIPVAKLSVIEYTAHLAGVEVESLAMAFKTASINLADFAHTHSGAAAKAIERLKLNVTDAGGKIRDISELLPELDDKLRGMGQAQRLGILGDIFGGRGAIGVDRVLKGGRFREMEAELRSLGGVVDEETANAAERVNDAISRVGVAWEGIKAQVVRALGDPLEAIFNQLALRIAKIPDQVRAIAYAVAEVVKSGPNSEVATAQLTALKETFVSLITTTAVEVGRVIGITFIQAIQIGLTALAPTLADLFRDTLGPIFSALPGVNIEKSAAGKLADLKTKLGDRSATRRTLESSRSSIEDDLANNPYLDGQERARVQSQLSSTYAGLRQLEAEESSKSNEALRKQIAEQTELVAKTAKERTRAMVLAFSDGFTEAADAVDRARVRIGGAADNFNAAANALTDLYHSANPETPKAADPAAAIKGFVDSAVYRFRSLADWAEQGATKVTKAMRRISEEISKNRATGWASRELDARGFASGGAIDGGDQAARIRLVVAQEKERVELMTKQGDAIDTLLPKLERVQAQELRRFDVDSRVKDLLDELKRSEKEYADAVQLRGAQVEAGSLSMSRATELNEAGRLGLINLSESTRTELQGIAAAYPEFAQVIGQSTKDVTAQLRLMRAELDGLDRSNFGSGLRAGIEDLRKEAADTYGFARRAVNDVAQSFASGLSNAIVDVISGTRSLKDAFRDFASSTLKMISNLILQFLILKAISGIAGAFSGSGAATATTGPAGAGVTQIPDLAGPYAFPVANKGGVIGRIGNRGVWAAAAGLAMFANGGAVLGGANVNRDSVLAGLTYGEGVLNRQAMRTNGLSTLGFMNAGGKVAPVGSSGGPGAVVVHQTNHFAGRGSVSPEELRGMREASKEGVLDGLRRDHAFRESVKRVLG